MQAVHVHLDLRGLLGRDLVIGRRELDLALRIVERAYRIVVERRVVESDMVVVGPDRDILTAQLRIAAPQDRHHVARGSRRFDEGESAPDRLAGHAHGRAIRGTAEDLPGRRCRQVEIRWLLWWRRAARHHDLRILEKAAQLGGHRIEAHHRHGRGVPVSRARAGSRNEPPGLARIWMSRHRDHHKLPRGLVWSEHRGITPRAREDGLGVVDRMGRSALVARQIVFPQPQRNAVDREVRGAGEPALHQRHILEVAARIAGGNQADALHFGPDVGGGLEIVLGAGRPAHHRIIGVEVKARHQISGRDRGLRGQRRMLERERGLRTRASS